MWDDTTLHFAQRTPTQPPGTHHTAAHAGFQSRMTIMIRWPDEFCREVSKDGLVVFVNFKLLLQVRHATPHTPRHATNTKQSFDSSSLWGTRPSYHTRPGDVHITPFDYTILSGGIQTTSISYAVYMDSDSRVILRPWSHPLHRHTMVIGRSIGSQHRE